LGAQGSPNELPARHCQRDAITIPDIDGIFIPGHFLFTNFPLANKDSQNLRQMSVFLQIRY
jgi:hypothetical protein